MIEERKEEGFSLAKILSLIHSIRQSIRNISSSVAEKVQTNIRKVFEPHLEKIREKISITKEILKEKMDKLKKYVGVVDRSIRYSFVTVSSALNRTKNIIFNKIIEVKDKLEGGMKKAEKYVSKKIDDASKVIHDMIEAAKDKISRVVQNAGSYVGKIINSVGSAIIKQIDISSEALRQKFNEIENIIKNSLRVLVGWEKKLENTLNNAFATLIDLVCSRLAEFFIFSEEDVKKYIDLVS